MAVDGVVDILRSDPGLVVALDLNRLGEHFFQHGEDDAPQVLVAVALDPVLSTVGGHFPSDGGFLESFHVKGLPFGTHDGVFGDFPGDLEGVGGGDDVAGADGDVLAVGLAGLILDQEFGLSDHLLHKVFSHGKHLGGGEQCKK